MSDSPEPSERARVPILTDLSLPTAAEARVPVPLKFSVSPLTKLPTVVKSLADAFVDPS